VKVVKGDTGVDAQPSVSRGLHIAWSADGAVDVDHSLADGMGRLLSQLSRPWTSQAFGSRLPKKVRRRLDAELKLARAESE
jgi:hypothetical protein